MENSNHLQPANEHRSDHWKRAIILSISARRPDSTIEAIAEAVGLYPETVDTILNSPSGRALTASIEAVQAEQISSLRTLALGRLEDILTDPSTKTETLLQAVKFTLQSQMSEKPDKSPDTLIFSTTISEGGNIERKQIAAK